MNVSVIGLGKLGCSMLAVFSEHFNVLGYDINQDTLDMLRKNECPIPSEPEVSAIMAGNWERINVTNSLIEVLSWSDIIFIVVPTPSKKDGKFSADFVRTVTDGILTASENLTWKDKKSVVLTSTLLPGDTRKNIIDPLKAIKSSDKQFSICYSPEFIALGSVVHDLKNPDFILLGEEHTESQCGTKLLEVLEKCTNKNVPVSYLTIEEAELAKIAINSYITMKINFANQIKLIADQLKETSPSRTLSAIGSDSRIGNRYLNPGPPFGGPCFPRDNRALAVFAESLGVDPSIALNTEKFNKNYLLSLIGKVNQRAVSKNFKRLVILGLSYKENSDVVVEAVGFELAKNLATDIEIVCVDPLVKKEAFGDLDILILKELSDLQMQKTDLIVICHKSYNGFICSTSSNVIKLWD